ncbi:MAG: hypothetical protein HQM08_13000 [Candidatus Riflebacteria bacterium]|nr:hypothetical protein [Candidatus Riflebacteria bacterium]
MTEERGNSCRFSLKTLQKWHRKAVTHLGIIDENQKIVVGNHDILNELLPRIDLAQALHLFIKKTIPEKNVADLLKSIVIACNYPDIRVWPIGSVAYAATSGGSCAASLSAGILSDDVKMFGARAVYETSNFLEEIKQELEKGQTLLVILAEVLKKGKTAFGFGRPLFRKDERVPVIIEAAKRNGLADGYWFNLANEIGKELSEKKGLILNFGGALTALLKDLDFDTEEIAAFANFIPIINFIGVYCEHRNSETPIFALSCEDIEYLGPEIIDK